MLQVKCTIGLFVGSCLINSCNSDVDDDAVQNVI